MNNTSNNNNNEADILSKTSRHFCSSLKENSDELHLLPSNSQVELRTQRRSSVLSNGSDLITDISSMNLKPLTKTLSSTLPSSVPFSFLTHRKRLSHRRNLIGLGPVTRDRKNSFSKSEKQTLSQDGQQRTPTFMHHMETIINQHLILINELFSNYSFNINISYSLQQLSIRNFLYTRLKEISQQNPMNDQCSRIETKAFIDLITNLQMNRAYHYQFLTNSVKDLLITNNDVMHYANRYDENENVDKGT